MTLLRLLPAVGLLAIATTATAQSGIGTIAPDPTVALHVKTNSPTQDIARLEGIRLGTTETDVIVKDASGKLRYRPIADLTVSGEWVYNGTSHIYAKRAQAGGNDVVVTNAGRFGIGTTAPSAAFHMNIGGDLVTATASTGVRIGAGGDFLGMDENELQAFESNTPGRLNFNPDGGSVIMGANSGNSLLMEVYGRARVTNLPVGDVDNVNPDDRIVTADAAGNLRAVTRDALETGEWRNHSTNAYIYAKRANDAGRSVVVTTAGNLGIGTTTPRARLDVAGGQLVVERSGTSVKGAIGGAEAIRIAGNTNGDAILSTNDGGDFEIKFNNNTGNQFLSTSNRFATRIVMDGNTNTAALNGQDGDAFGIRVSTVAGSTGTNVSWRSPFTIENSGEIGIGTTDPQRQFHVNGGIRFERSGVPTGVINNVPATDPQVLLIAPNGDVQRIASDQLFDNEGEWVDEPGGKYIYAKRARDEGSTDFVVVDDDGNMGFGLTAPVDKLHLRNAGMRFQNQLAGPYGYGISFNNEVPFPGAGTTDGARIYSDRDAFGSNLDALVFEKTDFNQPTVDGGFVFSTRGNGASRDDRLTIRGNGNVGIGTTAPTDKFHVFGNTLVQTGGFGNSATGGLMRTGDPYNNPVSWAVNGLQASDETDGAFFGVRTLGSNRADGVILWGDNNEDNFKFYHSNGATTTEVIHLDGATKNVGIGTATPSARLHVGGNVRIDNLPAGDLNKIAPDDELVTADANGNLRKVPASALFQTFEDDDWVINGINIYNKNVGNVGIGTTNPTFKFDVNGAMRLAVGNFFQLGASGNNRITVIDDNEIIHSVNTRYRFQSRGGNELLTIRGSNAGGVGIGTTAPDDSYGIDLAQDARLKLGKRLVFSDDNLSSNNSRNYMYGFSSTVLRTRVNDLWSIRNNADGGDVLTVKSAGSGRVGVLTDAPSTDFDVNGQVKIRSLPNGATGDFLVTADVAGNLRRTPQQVFEGPWDRRTTPGNETYLRNNGDRVGIGTTSPTAKLHVFEATGTAMTANAGTILLEHDDPGGESSIVFRSRVNRGSDFAYLQYKDNGSGNTGSAENSLLEIGVQNDNVGNFQDDIAIMPSGRLGVNTRAPKRELHVEGDVRITDMPTVNNTTDFAVTVDNNGDLRKQPITSIRDNLGNHQMTQNLQVNDFTISNSGGTGIGLKFSPNNSAMFSNRLQLGNHTTTWIEKVLSGVTPGFAGNDGAIFAPVYTGAETSDLRLYILDNPDDKFSIWGNPCGSTDCSNIDASKMVTTFRADGQITVGQFAFGTGADQVVLSDRFGNLKLGGVPGSGPSTGGDNLGNHVATQNINLNNRAIVGNGGFSLDAGAGRINLPNGGPITWSSLYGTAIVGDVQANGEGGQNDLRLEASDDIYLQTKGNQGDLILRGSGDVDFQVRKRMFFSSSDNNANFNIQFQTRNVDRFSIENNGTVKVNNLAGGGNRIVTAAPDGTLQVMSGSSTGLWDRDAGNARTYLTNGNDRVGIGTNAPTSNLHVSGNRNLASGPVEMTIHNTDGNGESALFFQETFNYAAGVRIKYNAGTNSLYFQDGAGTNNLMTLERDSKSVGIGTVNPNDDVALHISRVGNQSPGKATSDNQPTRMRLQNEFNDGLAAFELMEGTGNPGNNNAMTMRYNGVNPEALEFVRGDANSTDVKLAIARNSGEVKVTNLATGFDKMVTADANGVLRTRDFDAALWGRVGSATTLANTADNVGIGVTVPTAKLHVNGTLRVEGLVPGATTDNFVVADAQGNLRSLPASTFTNYWARAGAGELVLATASDRLGIGTTPASGIKVHVGVGNVRLDGLAGATTRIVTADALGTLSTQTLDLYESHWRRDAITGHVRLATGTDLVGIGIAAPLARLHVGTGKVRINDLAVAGGNRQVMADANGELYTAPATSLLWARDIANQYTYAINGGDKIGIGTSTPATKLHVASGAVTINDLYSATGDQTTDRVVVASSTGELKSLPLGTLSSPWFEDGSARVKLRNNDSWVGIGTQSPLSVLHVEDDISNATGTMEMRLQNRANNGEVNLRFRTGSNSGGFNDQNNSMVLRYTNQYDAMEITNGYARADVNYSSYFKVRRADGRVGINIGTANPADQLHIGAGHLRLGDGDIRLAQRHRLQFADANSYLGDNGDPSNDDLYLSAEEDMFVLGRKSVYIRANTAADGDFDARARRNIYQEAGGNFEIRSGNGTGERIIFRRGGNEVGSFLDNDRLRVNTLNGGGTQMVVADNAGTLSKQAIPTYDNYWTRDGANNRVTTTTAGDQVVVNGIGSGVGVLQSTSRLYVNGIIQSSTLSSAGPANRMVVALPSGQMITQALPSFTDTDDQTLSYSSATGLLTISKSGSTVNLGTEVSIDDQQLSLSGNVLSLTNSASVTLPANTDNQTLSYNSATGTLTISGSASSVTLATTPWTRTGAAVTLATAGGNVGIGTTAAPAARLHVTGTMRFDGLTAGAKTDSILTVAANGDVRRVALGRFQIGVAESKLTANLQTIGRYISNDGAAAGIFVGTGNRVAINGTPTTADVFTVRGGSFFGLSSTTGPSTKIDGGDITNSGKITTATFRMTSGTPLPGWVLTASDVNGNAVWAEPAVFSDERLKRDIAPMTGALDAIARLRNVTYRYKTATDAQGLILDTATHYGLIAQDVQKVFPHAITEHNGFLQLKERELTGILFAAANELREANAALDARNQRLEAELAEVKAAKTDLERDVHSLTAETRELQKNMTTVLRHIEAGKRVQAAEH